MNADWISSVEHAYVGHLPDPALKVTLPIVIKPYFKVSRLEALDSQF